MKIAYADPPYLGCCALYGHDHGDDGRCWDDVETHWLLMERLNQDFPDGWALSASSPSLAALLSRHQWEDVRISPWVKPFAVFKPNVNPAYAWEPVIWRGGRKSRSREEPTVRDWFSGNITLKRGLTGAKPERFCFWLFDLLGLSLDDEFVDLFHGSGAVELAWKRYAERLPLSGCSMNEPTQATTAATLRELLRRLVEDCTCEFRDCPIHDEARQVL